MRTPRTAGLTALLSVLLTVALQRPARRLLGPLNELD